MDSKADHYKAAVEYADAPLVDPEALYSWAALARDVGRLYQYVLRKGVAIEPIPKWRYQCFEDIVSDIEQGRIVRPTDFYPHPVWDVETQSLFRVVHDYFHYETGYDITIEGELNLVLNHHRLKFSQASYPAIVAEIYGQAAYNLVYGEFGPNKVYIPDLAREAHEAQVKLHAERWDCSSLTANEVLDSSRWESKLCLQGI